MTVLKKIKGLLVLIPLYVVMVVLSNLRIAWDIVRIKPDIDPAILAVEVGPMSDIQLLVLTNLITMTPGTLTLEVSADKKTIYIHAMYADDEIAFRKSIKSFKRRILNAF